MNLELHQLVDRAWRFHDRFCGHSFVVHPSAPVLYFGDEKAYQSSRVKVLTVGLNPSHAEFPKDDPFRRFPGSERRDPQCYLQAMNGYFSTAPYRRWFDPAFEPLLNGLSSSYYNGHESVALHTDLCSPLPTNPTWSKLEPKACEELLDDGVTLWHDLIRYLRPDVILISIARRHRDVIRFPLIQPWRTVYTIPRKNPYEVHGAIMGIRQDKLVLAVFGRAANLPFGTLSKDHKYDVGAFIQSTYFPSR